jgi:hypothetical protein
MLLSTYDVDDDSVETAHRPIIRQYASQSAQDDGKFSYHEPTEELR